MRRHMFIVICGIVGAIFMLVNHANIKTFILKDIVGHWAELNIQHLADKGILKGYPDRTFHPNAPITRAEAAMILSKFKHSQQGATGASMTVLRNYNDQEEIPGWAKEAIADMTEKSIMKGYNDDTFRPNHYVLRDEAVQIIHGFTHNQILDIRHDQDKNARGQYITRAEFCTLILNSQNQA